MNAPESKGGYRLGHGVLKPRLVLAAQADIIPKLNRCYLSASHHGDGAAQFLFNDTLRDIEGAALFLHSANLDDARKILTTKSKKGLIS